MKASTHWLHQRFTGIIAFIFVPLLWKTLFLLHGNHTRETLVEWFKTPLISFIMVVLTLIGLYHVKLGIEIIIQDYISEKLRMFFVRLLKCILFALLFLFMAAAFRLHSIR